MDVSPGAAGTIELKGSGGQVTEPVAYPTSANEPIDCFNINETITLTAKPKSGYQFQSWDFNYWPLDLNEERNKTQNPLSFRNTYLLSDGYADNYNAIRNIKATFIRSSVPPDTPQNLSATDGTESGKVVITWEPSRGADYYILYWASSVQGDRTWLAQTSDTYYEDNNVISDNVYYYWVRAVNQYGQSGYSQPDSGSAYVDPIVEPPPPAYEPDPLSPEEVKQLLDNDRVENGVIVLDVSIPKFYDESHILCSINSPWNDMFDFVDFKKIADYKDNPVVVVDQDGSDSKIAAEYLASRGFSRAFYMNAGLLQWIANGWETVDSNYLYQCSLPPMANAGQDQEVMENVEFILNGSNSLAPDNGQLNYQWIQFKGIPVVIEDPDKATTKAFSPYVQQGGETLFFHLVVTDIDNNVDTDSVAINVIWENSPPEADAGDMQSVKSGDTVILNGSGSRDRDDGIVAYQWEQVSGTEAQLQNNTSQTARFTAPDIETDTQDLVFELTVTDEGGLSDKDEVTIVVSRNNAPPVADAGPDQEVTETHRVELDGSGSLDPDDGIASYFWQQVGDSSPTVQLSDPSAPKTSFTAPEVTEDFIILEFLLTVTDASGAFDTDSVFITVLDAGDPPVADAGIDQNPVYAGWQVNLDGSGSEPSDGEIQAYKWTQLKGPAVNLTGADRPLASFTAPETGGESIQLEFELKVTDNKGLNGTDRVKIIVESGVENPVADAGPDLEVRQGSKVVLDGSSSQDPDDGIARYQWRQINGEPEVALSGITTPEPEFTAPDVDEEKVLIFELTVFDYMQNTDKDEVQVTVLPKRSGGGGGGGGCFISSLEF